VESWRRFRSRTADKRKIPNYDTRVSVLGHIQRGGRPSCMDRCWQAGLVLLQLKLNGPATETKLVGRSTMRLPIPVWTLHPNTLPKLTPTFLKRSVERYWQYRQSCNACDRNAKKLKPLLAARKQYLFNVNFFLRTAGKVVIFLRVKAKTQALY